jgi:hypothetical protein
MKVHATVSAKDVLIYRDKWGVLAFYTVACLACLAIAVGAQIIARVETRSPMWFAYLFSGLFGIVGVVIAFRLPGQFRRLTNNAGALLLAATHEKLQVWPAIGADVRELPWASIAEIILAARLKSIEPGEQEDSRRTIIIFLREDAPKPAWFAAVHSGVYRSGAARRYLEAPYPRDQARMVEQALRRLAPDTVRIRRIDLAIFDFKKRTDTFA